MKIWLSVLLLAAGVLLWGASPFKWSSSADSGVLTVSVNVPDNCYLFAENTAVKAVGTDGKAQKLLSAPVPADKEGEKIYPAGVHKWRFSGNTGKITVDFQGCRIGDDGICYMPETVVLSGSTGANQESSGLPFRVIRTKEGFMNVPEFTAFLKGAASAGKPLVSGGVIMITVLALLGGLGLNLTPCVLPMIPVNLAILGADGSSWRKGLLRASFYGAGMAAAYGILGAAVVLTGAKFGALNSSWIFNAVIAVIFLLLSLAMFGVYNLDFSGLSARVAPGTANYGRNAAAFVLGAVSALLAGACVAPVVIAVIVLSSELYAGGNFAGVLLPLVLGIGMALPWPVAGAGLAVLPRPGQWMEQVKILFGILILGAAAYYGYLSWTLRPGEYDTAKEFARLEAAAADADAEGRPLLVKFSASWCKNCREMERKVFPSAEVKAALRDFHTVEFRAENINDPRIKQLLSALKINGLPAFVIAD